MKQIILTAVDDNDKFWFDHLIPFLLSLKNTDYQGDIGIISYGLSELKKRILTQNGCLVFPAPNKYKTVYIDRQWAVAMIAINYQYDQIALYDTDIWFPHIQLSLFSEIQDKSKLYCAYDVGYAGFIEDCTHNGLKIRELMQEFLSQHKSLWQVGLVAGYKDAWLNYKSYIEKVLLNDELFTQNYGIDSLLMCLYSMEYQGVLALPEKYNCMPIGGNLRFSNLSSDGQFLGKEVFTINNEPVQGLHITGPFRLWERNFYEYSNHHGVDYFSQGGAFRLKDSLRREIEHLPLIAFSQKYHQNKVPLCLTKVISDSEVKCSIEEQDILLTAGSNTQFHFLNTNEDKLELKFAISGVFGKSLVKGRFIARDNGKTPTIYHLNEWQEVILKPNERIIFACYDLNDNAGITWRLNNIMLVEE